MTNLNNMGIFQGFEDEQAHTIAAQLQQRNDEMAKMKKKQKPFLRITKIAFKRIILNIEGEIGGWDYLLEQTDWTKLKNHYGVRFVSDDRKRVFYPDYFEVDSEGKFQIKLNIMCSNKELPLQTGLYDLVLFQKYPKYENETNWTKDPKGDLLRFGTNLYRLRYDDDGYVQEKKLLTQEYPAFIDETLPHLCNNLVKNPWNFKVNKTKFSWLHVLSNEDMDTARFQLSVNYMPFPNYGVLFLHHKLRLQKIRIGLSTWKGNIYKDIADFKMWTFQKLNRLFQKFAKHEGNIILFCSNARAEISGNEKFIYDRMLERNLDKKFQFRFDFKNNINTNRSIWKMIKFDYYLATSDVIVLDDYYPIIYDLKYDKRVKVVQVWHACGAFKTVGFERIEKKDAPHFNSLTHKCYTHVIVSSEISAKHNAEAFCLSEDKFYITGIPRTDLFFNQSYREITTEKMLECFPQCKGKKVYLYAPTFRGTNARDAYFPFGAVDLEQWGQLLEEEDAILILKMHPFVTQHMDIPKNYRDRILDATDYREVNDILFLVDILITDYSSVIYEMSLLRKPMIFYAFDQRSYEYSRDFYEPYEETVPGKIVHDFDELIDCLRNGDYEYYKMDHFIQKNFAHTDGKSTDRIIDQIFLDKKR
ncbi:MAG: CDP-glycerol glycerophosphotransferase family protein [Ruminococcus sp.]|nr:CDP-glycerol glycerophosphotransferase family protein [Ruminococcus sp.]